MSLSERELSEIEGAYERVARPLSPVGPTSLERAVPRLISALREARRQDKALQRVAQFGASILARFHDDLCDLDGFDIEQHALEAGVIRKEQVSEPCGEDCVCAEYGMPSECNVYTDGVTAIIDHARALSTDNTRVASTETRE